MLRLKAGYIPVMLIIAPTAARRQKQANRINQETQKNTPMSNPKPTPAQIKQNGVSLTESLYLAQIHQDGATPWAEKLHALQQQVDRYREALETIISKSEEYQKIFPENINNSMGNHLTNIAKETLYKGDKKKEGEV
jgi:hypothetical protein